MGKYNNGVWLSLVERYVRDVEAAGSNPVTPMLRIIPYGVILFFIISKAFITIHNKKTAVHYIDDDLNRL